MSLLSTYLAHAYPCPLPFISPPPSLSPSLPPSLPSYLPPPSLSPSLPPSLPSYLPPPCSIHYPPPLLLTCLQVFVILNFKCLILSDLVYATLHLIPMLLWTHFLPLQPPSPLHYPQSPITTSQRTPGTHHTYYGRRLFQYKDCCEGNVHITNEDL